MKTTNKSHRPQFGRWGLAEDLRDVDLAWDDPQSGAHYIARCVTLSRNEARGITIAHCVFPDGELIDVPVSVTVVLER